MQNPFGNTRDLCATSSIIGSQSMLKQGKLNCRTINFVPKFGIYLHFKLHAYSLLFTDHSTLQSIVYIWLNIPIGFMVSPVQIQLPLTCITILFLFNQLPHHRKGGMGYLFCFALMFSQLWYVFAPSNQIPTRESVLGHQNICFLRSFSTCW